MARKLTDEQRWRAEEDARTLKRAAEIKNDKVRLGRATEQITKEYQVMGAVIGEVKKPTTRKTPVTKAPVKRSTTKTKK